MGVTIGQKLRVTNYKLLVKTAAIISMFCMLAGCGFIYYHNPEKARETANTFLSFLYTEKDIDKAYDMTNKFYKDNFGRQDLEKTSSYFLTKFGKFEGTRAKDYFTEGGSKELIVFYVAVSEGGITYQKVILNDEGKEGYKVSGLVISDKPFTGYRLIKHYKEL
jgi:hypothetical protein